MCYNKDLDKNQLNNPSVETIEDTTMSAYNTMNEDTLSPSQDEEMETPIEKTSIDNFLPKEKISNSKDTHTPSSPSKNKRRNEKNDEIIWLKKLLNFLSLETSKFPVKGAYALLLAIGIAMININLGYNLNYQREEIDQLEKSIKTTYIKQQSLTHELHHFMRRSEVVKQLQEKKMDLHPTDEIAYILYTDID